jgi:hypothetical protein
MTMKETIYTIPVNEAFAADAECPICHMLAGIEARALNCLVGPDNAYMQGDVRMKTDEKGFCGKHFAALFKANNTLGLALMVETHLRKMNKELKKKIEDVRKGVKRSILTKGTIRQSGFAGYTEKQVRNCYICDMVDEVYPRYMDTFLRLWREEREMRERVKNGRGFCMGHFIDVMDVAAAGLAERDYGMFCDCVIPAQVAGFKRMEDEVAWFVQKFDYRFRDEPWGNSKDSIQRAILKLTSVEVTK